MMAIPLLCQQPLVPRLDFIFVRVTQVRCPPSGLQSFTCPLDTFCHDHPEIAGEFLKFFVGPNNTRFSERQTWSTPSPENLHALWIEVLNITLRWIVDETDVRRREAAGWLFRAIAPMLLRKGEGSGAPCGRRFPMRARLEAFIPGDWEALWHDLQGFLEADKRRRAARAVSCRQGNIVELAVTNSNAPLTWTAGIANANATILLENDEISC